MGETEVGLWDCLEVVGSVWRGVSVDLFPIFFFFILSPPANPSRNVDTDNDVHRFGS